MPQIVPSQQAVTQVSCDALVVGAYAADASFELSPSATRVDEALDRYLSEHLEDQSFKAEPGRLVTIPTMKRLPARTVVVMGLGKRSELSSRTIRRVAGGAARRLSERADIATSLHEGKDLDAVSAAAEGFLLGSYRYSALKSDPRPSRIQRVVLLGADPDAAARGAAIAEATLLARDLVNEPAGTLTPDALARRAREMADVEGLDCTILDETAIAERGLNGVTTVAKGSEVPPRFIQLHYRPESPTGTVALVGKGVTFDSGGLSMKDPKNMEAMKTDMAGAAAVIATMSVLKRLNVRTEVTAHIPAVENMPSGSAVKPGDVIHHRGGKTSEVLNTDAEGRLILADALALATESTPDAVIDVATLTGSIVIALGRDIMGLFANDDALAEEIHAAAERAGESMWRMPLHKDYRKQLDSQIADLKNVGDRYGGSIVAALFLEEFVREGTPWAHLDIAGAARSETDDDEGPKGGTGSATRTLIAWLERRGR